MQRLPERALLEIVRFPHETLRGLAKRLCVSTHTIQRIRRLALPAAASLEEIKAALYKPPLHVESVKTPIDFAAVIEHRAVGLSIKDCWKVYRKENTSGFSLSAFSALVKKNAEVPAGFIPVGGPVAVPVNSHCERIYWPEPVTTVDDGANPLDGVLGVNEDGSTIKARYGDLLVESHRAGASFRFMKATHGLKAVVVDCDAMISTAALDWLQQQHVPLFVQLGDALRVFATESPSSIRKVQYAADSLKMGKIVVLQKFADWSGRIPEHPRSDGRIALLAEVNAARSIGALRLIEARYSLAYWRSNSPLSLPHFKSFPTAWRTWNGVRVSPISGVNSSATHPVNALLNYAYAIVEARYELAASVRGPLDLSRACLHDGEHRKGLVFDLVEFDRLKTTERVLGLIRGRTWKRDDFRVDLKGCVRLQPGVAREVVAAVLPSRSHVRDVTNRYCRGFENV